MAAYLLTNRELRRELGQAESSTDVLKSMGQHMRRDMRDVARDARQGASVMGERVRGRMHSLAERLSAVRREARREAGEAAEQAERSVKRVRRAAATGVATADMPGK